MTAASFGNEAQIWQLTDTGLVVNDDGALRFALPVFEQHFGAHALKRGIVALEEAAPPEAFPRWRYAIAFALSTSRAGTSRAVHAAPGADESRCGLVDAERTRRQRSFHSRPRARAGYLARHGRLRPEPGSTLRSRKAGGYVKPSRHSSTVSEHAAASYPGTGTADLVQWGVQLLGDDRIALSEARETLPPPDLVAVAFDPWDSPAPEWVRRTMFAIPRGSWQVVLGAELAHAAAGRTDPAAPAAPAAGLTARARAPVDTRTADHADRQETARHRHPPRRPPASGGRHDGDSGTISPCHLAGGGIRIDSHDIRWIHAQLQRETGEQLYPPWPAPDQPAVRERWPVAGLLPDTTHAIRPRCCALPSPDTATSSTENFAAFGWALGLNSALPVQVEGTARHPRRRHRRRVHQPVLPAETRRRADREARPHVHLDLVTQPGGRVARRAGLRVAI